MSNMMPGPEPDDGLTGRQIALIEERAREMAADDPDLEFPAAELPDEIELEELPTQFYEYRFRATYQGRSVEVCVPGEILDPDEPNYWFDDE